MTVDAAEVRVEAVMIVDQVGSALAKRLERVAASLEGFEGDRHAGAMRPAGVRDKPVPRGTPVRNDRQVTAVSVEELARIAVALDVSHVDPAWLGANLALSGYPEISHLPPGSELVFPDGTVLVVEAQNEPCTNPGELIQAAYPEQSGLASAFPKAAYELRGVTASVRTPGAIAVGDLVTLRLPA